MLLVMKRKEKINKASNKIGGKKLFLLRIGIKTKEKINILRKIVLIRK